MKRNRLIWAAASAALLITIALVVPGQVSAWRHRLSLDSTHVTYVRQPCAGTPCPAYRVDIYGNGKVIYRGIDQVATPGAWTYHIERKALHAWLSDFRVSGFWSRPRSSAPAAGGGSCSVTLIIHRKPVSNGCYDLAGDDGMTLESAAVAADVTQMEAILHLDSLTKPHTGSTSNHDKLPGLKPYKSMN